MDDQLQGRALPWRGYRRGDTDDGLDRMHPKPRLPAMPAGIFALLLTISGCARQAPAPPVCLDATADAVRILLTNEGSEPMRVPEKRPDIGCCRRSGLTLAVTDASGADLDRCGFADNFDLGRTVELRPGASIEYAVSAQTLSSVYCQVDLRRHYLSVHDGARPLGTHPLQPCGAAVSQPQPPAR